MICQRPAHYHRHPGSRLGFWLMGRAEILCFLQNSFFWRAYATTHPYICRTSVGQCVCRSLCSQPQVLPQGHGAKTLPSRQAASCRPDRRARTVVSKRSPIEMSRGYQPEDQTRSTSVFRGPGNPTPVIHPDPPEGFARRASSDASPSPGHQAGSRRLSLVGNPAPSTKLSRPKPIACGNSEVATMVELGKFRACSQAKI